MSGPHITVELNSGLLAWSRPDRRVSQRYHTDCFQDNRPTAELHP
jgi:hypothetical protein